MSYLWPHRPLQPGREAAPLCNLVTPNPGLRAVLKQGPCLMPQYPRPSAQYPYVERPSFMFTVWVTDPTVWHTRKQVQRGRGTCPHSKVRERAKARSQVSWIPALLSHIPATLSVHTMFGKIFMHLWAFVNSVWCLTLKRTSLRILVGA